MSWKKISEIIHSPISGEWGDEGDEVKVLRTTNFTNEGKLNLNNVVTRSVDLKKIEKKKLVYGDTIIEKSGGSPSQPVGRVVYFDISDEEYICNNFTSILRISDEKFDQKYFFWSLFYQHIAKNTLQFQNKTTGIINLQLTKYLEQTSLKELPLQTQKHIASILDKADALRQQNRQLLAYYDALLQSTFIEMFGDPVENPKGWKKIELKQVAVLDGIKCGPFGSQLHKEDFQHDGVPLWGIKQVNKNFEIRTKEFLTPEKAYELQTYSINPYDIVMTRKGTIGNCAVYPKGWENGVMHSDLLRIRVDTSKCNPGFLSAQLRYSEDIIHQISLISSGAIMAGINVGKLKKIVVLNPPLPLQKLFSEIVEEIEQQKEQVKQSLAESESLFQGLLSTYFGNN